MHKIEKTAKLTVKSYPVVLVSLPVVFVFLLFIALHLNPSPDWGILDSFMFLCVTGALIVIQKYRKVIFDPQNDLCIINVTNILGKKEVRIKCSDINNFSMVYGHGGGHARGGTLVLNRNDQNFHTIIGSDIGPKNAKKTIAAKGIIEEFLDYTLQQ